MRARSSTRRRAVAVPPAAAGSEVSVTSLRLREATFTPGTCGRHFPDRRQVSADGTGKPVLKNFSASHRLSLARRARNKSLQDYAPAVFSCVPAKAANCAACSSGPGAHSATVSVSPREPLEGSAPSLRGRDCRVRRQADSLFHAMPPRPKQDRPTAATRHRRRGALHSPSFARTCQSRCAGSPSSAAPRPHDSALFPSSIGLRRTLCHTRRPRSFASSSPPPCKGLVSPREIEPRKASWPASHQPFAGRAAKRRVPRGFTG